MEQLKLAREDLRVSHEELKLTREEMKGHGTREMPLWGVVFQIEEGASGSDTKIDMVRGRIWQLVYFLQSIQEQ